MAELSLDDAEHISLCEALDRILHKGAVITGDLTISVADIDLIYVGLRVLISSAGAIRAPDRGNARLEESHFREGTNFHDAR
jgi:Gas vesicle protein